MVLSSVLSFAKSEVQTDSNGLTDANGVVFANEALMDFHRRLVEKSVDASQLQESSVLTSSGINSYPSNPSCLALKTIEVNSTDTTNSNYKVAHQIDVANLPGGSSFSWLRTNADISTPLFDDRGDKYEIFPTPTAPTMVRMFYYAQPSVFTAVANTVNYPENMDTAILGWRIAADYLYSLQNYADGDKCNAKYEERVTQYIGTLAKGSQQPIQATPLQVTGWEF